MNLELLKSLCKLPTEKLRDLLSNFLKKYPFKELKINKNYIYAQGDIPVCLVAHLDTVYDEYNCREETMIFHDQEEEVLISPHGIAGDDRCGVYAIIEILKAGYLPSVIFTLGEEVGGLGAYRICQEIPKPPHINFFLELDRQGANDAVMYQCKNRNFMNYICSFGFEEQIGSFTDITILMDFWKICGINVSVGYYNEHCLGSEFIRLNELEESIKKVKEILEDNVNNIHKWKCI